MSATLAEYSGGEIGRSAAESCNRRKFASDSGISAPQSGIRFWTLLNSLRLVRILKHRTGFMGAAERCVVVDPRRRRTIHERQILRNQS